LDAAVGEKSMSCCRAVQVKATDPPTTTPVKKTAIVSSPRTWGLMTFLRLQSQPVDDGTVALQHKDMKRMSLAKFGRLVRGVLDALPEEIARHLDNVVVDVEEEADEETLRQLGFTDEEIAEFETPYGLFVLMPLGRSFDDDHTGFLEEPHRIVIFKRPLEEDFPDPRQLRIEIRKTIIHELAHHFGWEDKDLERFDATEDPFGD
jgi:predicted Zn-dependent protease with MMP-like domain